MHVDVIKILLNISSQAYTESVINEHMIIFGHMVLTVLVLKYKTLESYNKMYGMH